MSDLIYLNHDGTEFARVTLGPEGDVANAPNRDGRVVGWSGVIADEEPARAALRAWGGDGRAAIDTVIAGRLAEDPGVEMVVVPRAVDVVSDLPSAMSLVRRWSNGELGRGRVKLLIDAELLLTEEMRRHAADHAARCVAAAEILGPSLVAGVCCGTHDGSVSEGLRVVVRAGRGIV